MRLKLLYWNDSVKSVKSFTYVKTGRIINDPLCTIFCSLSSIEINRELNKSKICSIRSISPSLNDMYSVVWKTALTVYFAEPVVAVASGAAITTTVVNVVDVLSVSRSSHCTFFYITVDCLEGGYHLTLKLKVCSVGFIPTRMLCYLDTFWVITGEILGANRTKVRFITTSRKYWVQSTLWSDLTNSLLSSLHIYLLYKNYGRKSTTICSKSSVLSQYPLLNTVCDTLCKIFVCKIFALEVNIRKCKCEVKTSIFLVK